MVPWKCVNYAIIENIQASENLYGRVMVSFFPLQGVSPTAWRTVLIRSIWWQPLSGPAWRPPLFIQNLMEPLTGERIRTGYETEHVSIVSISEEQLSHFFFFSLYVFQISSRSDQCCSSRGSPGSRRRCWKPGFRNLGARHRPCLPPPSRPLP